MTAEPVRTWASADAAEGWRQGAARRALTLAVVTEQMFQAAGLREGQRVLDVAAGTGEQSVLAAQRVGPSGSVLAVDVSPSMLALAAAAAHEAGLANVTTEVADASELELAGESFDAAICRYGLMFMPDLHQALVRIRGALKSGARFAAVVWSTEASNPYLGLQLGLVREMGRMPSPLPTMARTVSLSEPGRLGTAFQDAGFVRSSVKVTPVPVPRVFASVDDALGAMRTSTPFDSDLGRDMSDAERAHYWAELAGRLQAYVQPDGKCVMPGQALLAAGAK